MSDLSDRFGILWESQTEFLRSDTLITAMFAGAGTGKCVRDSTPVLMYDGRVIPASEVVIGDRLMGTEGPRTVLDIHRGAEPLVRVVPVKGDPFEVTINHQLTLSRSYSKRGEPKGQLRDVTVAEWLKWAPTERKFWKLVRSAVDFASTAPLPIDPYFLGGSLCGGEDKFIPHEYKTASRHDRLEILAGLMDTDGSRLVDGYDFVSKSERLARDVAFVARSVGIAAYVKETRKSCQTGAVGTYWRVSISGASAIPARLRPPAPRKQAKSVLHTGFHVEYSGHAPWVGFVLDGDQRFLLGDFTVTHNSKVLAERIVKDHSMHDGWWKDRIEFNTQPLILMVGAAHEAYLAENTVPLLRAAIDSAEDRAGRRLRKRTGRNRDGWYGSVGHRYQDMANCTQIHIKSFPTKENAVAVTVAGLYFDEITMFSDPEIWRRSLQRVRDPRAGKRPSGKTWDFVACVGTPEEDHWIRDALMDAETGEPFPGVNIIMDSSLNNPLLPDSWFINAGRHSSEIFKRMQIMGEWVKGAGGQRFAHIFDEKRHIVHLEAPRGNAGLKFDIGWDPGYRTGSVVVMWQHPATGAWYVVDEIVIIDKTTNDVCSELLAKGYNCTNIRSICMDPRDNKRRSTSEKSDGDIVFQRMQIRPKNKHIGEGQGQLHVRLDALEDMIKANRFFVSDKILPRSREQLGLVNALHRFATEKADENPEVFIDKPTRDTVQRWKHPIDAVHYVLMHYERGVYSRVTRNSSRDQVRRVRSGA